MTDRPLSPISRRIAVQQLFAFLIAELLDALLYRNGSAAGSDDENSGAAGSESSTANGHTPGAAAASNGEHVRNRHKHTSTSTATDKHYTPEQVEAVKR